MNYTKNLDELLAACHEHMAQNNLAPSQPLNPNGRVQRYSSRGIKNSADEWYIIFVITHGDNTYIICIYGSWRTGEKHEFKSYESLPISEQDKQYLHEQWRQKQDETNQLLQKAKDNAAVIAKKLWGEAAQEPPSEDYLAYTILKGIRPIGARFIFFKDRPTVLLALKNIDGEIRTLQYIYKDDNGKMQKRFLLSGEKQGNFLTLGEITKESAIYVVEGWATGVSVFSATSAPVIVAYDASNIPPVVEAIRSKFPENIIFIAGDNDPSPHTGQKYAHNTAKKYNCRAVFPQFPENNNANANGKPYTDFNDLHQICGIDEVKKQLIATVDYNTPESSSDDCQQLIALAQSFLEQKNPCENFSLSSFPAPLREYIQALCKTTNADPIMITMSVLTTVSAFLGRRVSYRDYFQSLFPNIWVLAITKSGNFKTTALNKGSSLAWKKHEKIMNAIKEIEQKIRVATNKEEKLKLEEEKLSISLSDVILPTKVTGEALLEHLSHGHTGVILSSEFGAFLQNLAKNHNNDLKPLFTDLYDVPTAYRYKTRTQGDLILKEPCFSICGVSTIPWIKDAIKTTDVASGFFARFLLFTPSHSDDIPPALPVLNQASTYTQQEQQLEEILKRVPATLTYNALEGNALIFFEALHERIYTLPRKNGEDVLEMLEPYFKRWSPSLLKLAMLMQIIEDPTSHTISTNAILAAANIIFVAMQSTIYLFRKELGGSYHDNHCSALFEWICSKVQKTGKPVMRRDILASRKVTGGQTEYDKTLQMLIEQGKIRVEETGKKADWLYHLEFQTSEPNAQKTSNRQNPLPYKEILCAEETI